MSDFQKLNVYHKSKTYNHQVCQLVLANRFDRHVNDQLKRASFSIMLNIAEGTGRYTKRDKRNFYVIARSSAFECVAIFDFIQDLKVVEESVIMNLVQELEEISKMLFAMMRNLE
jgi:four helix bundle protein